MQETFLRDNVLINTNVVRAAVEAKVSRDTYSTPPCGAEEHALFFCVIWLTTSWLSFQRNGSVVDLHECSSQVPRAIFCLSTCAYPETVPTRPLVEEYLQ